MHTPKLSNLMVLALAAAALAGCSDKIVPIEVAVLGSNLCGRGPDPLQDVTHVRLRVLDSQNGVVVEKVAERAAAKDAIPELPNGQPLRLAAAGFNGAPPEGTLVSYGMSSAFTVPSTLEGDAQGIKVNVFLRPVERFSPAVRGDDPAQCAEMSRGRAGHTATLLADGRVLLAGGFEADGRNSLGWQYTETAEIFDPASGTLAAAPSMNFRNQPTPRAFHTATRLDNGQVLIAGGEFVSTQPAGPSYLASAFSALLFDDSGGNITWIPVRLQKQRSRHVAARGANGRVVLVGGVNWKETGTADFVETFEWFESEPNPVFKIPALSDPAAAVRRVGHAGLAVLGDNYAIFAGGAQQDAGGAVALSGSDGVRFFNMQKAEVGAPEGGVSLSVPRSWMSAANVSKGFLLLGGMTEFNAANPQDVLVGTPYGGTDYVTLAGSPVRLDGPSLYTPRGHVCSVTLADGRVLAIGGRAAAATAGTYESSTATTSFMDDRGSIVSQLADSMGQGRFLHSCTLLADGSVLVAGGIAESGGQFVTLRSLEVYMPRPAE